jgi:hypothetical protein
MKKRNNHKAKKTMEEKLLIYLNENDILIDNICSTTTEQTQCQKKI